MYQLNNKLSELVPYEPINGTYKIRLDANESCFNLDERTKSKIAARISEIAFNRYPESSAYGACKAFADMYGLNTENVTAGNGSDELISVIMSCFLESGDTAVTLSNDFSMYGFYGSLYEVNIEVFEKNNDLTIDVDKLIGFCTEKNAKALIFSNPCNPTSLGLDRQQVRKILTSLKCLVILDEAYMDFWSESILDEIEKYDNCIILKTCSKAIGIAAVRMGFAVAGSKISRALKAVKAPYNTDTISQVITQVVLSDTELLAERCNKIVNNTGILYRGICEINDKYGYFEKVYETKTNFVFIKTDKFNEIYNYLLENSIAIRKFNGFLRISTGTEDENTKLLEVLENACRKD